MLQRLLLSALLIITGSVVYSQCTPSDFEIIATPDLSNPPDGYIITVKRVNNAPQSGVSNLVVDFGNGTTSGASYSGSLPHDFETTYDECELITVLVDFRVFCTPTDPAVLIADLELNFVTAGGIGDISETDNSCGEFDFTTTASGTNLIWSFGDGSYATDNNSTTHTYTSNGVYVVTVTDPLAPGFCPDYVQVVVDDLPESEIFAVTSCVANTVDLSASGLPGNTYSWNMGDGTSPVSGQNPAVHTYSSPGLYLVTLTVTDGLSCSSIETMWVQVGPPDLNIFVEDICVTEAFTPQWVPGGGVTYSWDLGDGTTSSLQYPVHTYEITEEGPSQEFTVELTMTDANGCVSVTDEVILVSEEPVLDIATYPSVCNSMVYTLVPTAENATLLFWQAGGFNIPAENEVPYDHLFTSEGLQTVTLLGQNGACEATTSTQINVSDGLSISLSGNMTLCEGEATTITSSISGGNGSYTYNWLLDEISIGTGPSIALTTPGDYILKVMQDGCTGYYSQEFTLEMVEKPVISDLGITGTTCPGNTAGEVEITFSTVPDEGYIVNGSSVQSGATFTVDGLTEGTYYLNIFNAENPTCDVVEQIVIVYEGPTVSIETTPESCSSGGDIEASLENAGAASITGVDWFEVGNPVSVSSSNPYTGANAGLYYAVVTISAPSGCELTSTTAQLLEPVVSITFEDTYICENAGTTEVIANPAISDGISGSFTYLWQNETPSTVGTTQSVSLSAGTYTVTVTETGTGCESIETVTLTEIEEIAISPSNTPIGCTVEGAASVYVTGGSGDFMYDWTIPGPSTIENATPSLTGLTDPGNYTVTVTDLTYNCVAEEVIVVSASPEITDVTVTPGDCAATAAVTGGTAPFMYQWINENVDPVDIISVTSSNVKSGLTPGDYSVNVVDAYGCEYESEPFTVTEPTSTLDISFKFTFGPKEEPEVEEIDEELVEAMQSTADQMMEQLSDCIINQTLTLKTEFKGSCLDINNFSDKLSLRYQLEQQQYTLFYYDRSGNLTKTVPPAGVEFLADPQIADIKDFRADVETTSPEIYNNHRLESKYDYNSLGQIIIQQTPDGGTSKFIYDDLQRLRFSQSARQAVVGTYSYTKYDELGRPFEVGESNVSGLDFSDLLDAGNLILSNDMNFPATGTSVMYYVYTEPSSATYYGEGQTYLQNRISHVIKDEDGDIITTNDQYKTHYSYDVHGNVKWLVQEDPVIGKNYVRYEYDLVSGNVKQVSYNEKREDRFFHRYIYDADDRVVSVETSRDAVIWDEDANYTYYLHGPVRRNEIGEDDIQGTDVTYTIHGWLKAINNSENTLIADPNQDGEGSTSFQQDVFGMSLGFFEDDFTRGGGIFDDMNLYQGDADATDDLYNSNISSWASHTNTGNPIESKTNISVYTYDDLNRIKSQQYFTNTGIGSIDYTQTAANNFKTAYSFDRNGNLLTMLRHDEAGAMLDNISYVYTEGGGTSCNIQKNQLTSVADAVTTENPVGLYGEHTYTYDASGNLIEDSGQEIIDGDVHDVVLNISWTVTGKVKQIEKSVTNTIGTPVTREELITFQYDAMDNRIGKTHIADLTEPELMDMTRYVVDATGNVMGIYQIDVTEDDGTYTAELNLVEHPIYGSARLGLDNIEVPLQSWEFTSGFEPEYFYDEDGTSTITELSNWIMSSIKSVQAGDGAGTELCQCEIKHTAFAEVTPDNYEFDEGTITGTFYGKIENGLTVGETTEGEVKLYAVLVENYLGTTNQCLVLNTDGDPVKGTEDISEIMPTSKPILSQVTGNPEYFRLFTIDENNHPTMHVINTQAQGWGGSGETKAEIETSNTVLNSDYKYGKHVAVMEDHINNKTVVYMTRYAAPEDEECLGATEIVAYVYGEDPNGAPQEYILTSIESKDSKGQGELQLSTDGTTLVYYNRTDNISGFAHKTIELNKFVLGGDKTTVTDQQVITRNYEGDGNAAHYGTYGKASVEFGADGSLYFSQNNLFEENEASSITQDGSEKQVLFYDATDGSFNYTMLAGETQFNEVRRGKNKLYYVPNEKEANKVNEMVLAALTPATEHSVFLNSGYVLISSVPSQPYKLVGDDLPGIFTRKVGGKQYEFTDHLGNVRAVVSDRRGFETIAADEISNQPELLSWADYDPYGMILPTRSGSNEKYRYGFGGLEGDDEIKGEGNSYSTEFRQYDPRVGRWLSTDPLMDRFPWQSPYAAFDNNPIYYSDPSGAASEKGDPDKKKGDIGDLNDVAGKANELQGQWVSLEKERASIEIMQTELFLLEQQMADIETSANWASMASALAPLFKTPKIGDGIVDGLSTFNDVANLGLRVTYNYLLESTEKRMDAYNQKVKDYNKSVKAYSKSLKSLNAVGFIDVQNIDGVYNVTKYILPSLTPGTIDPWITVKVGGDVFLFGQNPVDHKTYTVNEGREIKGLPDPVKVWTPDATMRSLIRLGKWGLRGGSKVPWRNPVLSPG